ncbi:MAG: hypothetical protein KJO26_01830 [Deltaproteobacteria bacterium]|nr:hypothetical protein [Deltaproteobacteria bacterium]
MASSAMIKIGVNTIKSSRQEVKFLKTILDKLEYPYILDGISFHNSLIDLNRMKTIHNTNVWKVEADGSVSLKNRFGHSGRFDYRYLRMPNLIEFQFVDLNFLTDEENDFLGYLIYEAETLPAVSEQFI